MNDEGSRDDLRNSLKRFREKAPLTGKGVDKQVKRILRKNMSSNE